MSAPHISPIEKLDLFIGFIADSSQIQDFKIKCDAELTRNNNLRTPHYFKALTLDE